MKRRRILWFFASVFAGACLAESVRQSNAGHNMISAALMLVAVANIVLALEDGNRDT